jgi:chromosome transmission fidelity protein 18
MSRDYSKAEEAWASSKEDIYMKKPEPVDHLIEEFEKRRNLKRRREAEEEEETQRKRARIEEERSAFFSKKGYSLKPPTGSCLHVTAKNGSRVYVQITDADKENESENNAKSIWMSSGQVLGVSMQELRKRIDEEDKFEYFSLKEKEEQKALKDAQKKQELPVDPNAPRVVRESELWVDKFSPKHFMELLSDERTNRSVLTWMKEWDPFVFNKPFVKPSTGSRFAAGTGEDGGAVEADKKSRPLKRVILISGPPGIGKTTLAHVVARHAGYDPIEFNASDDRTAASFIPKVMDVIDTQTSFSKSNKPRCLIIDEIDGVAGGEKGSIEALVKIIDEIVDPAKAGKKNYRAPKVRRPIICICNDLYAPALKPLVERALLFRLEPPSVQSLVTRLAFICKKEGVQADSRTLHALCELSNNDIRACLNTLQFLSKKKEKSLTGSVLISSTFGQKDILMNVFDIWRAVFLNQEKSSALKSLLQEELRNQRKNEKDNIGAPVAKPKFQLSDFERIYNMTISSGEPDIIIDGCFENYLDVRYSDPNMHKTVHTIDMMEFYSMMQKSAREEMFFNLEQYTPAVAVATNMNCSVAHLTNRINFPKSNQTARYAQQTTENILKSLFDGTNILTRLFLTRDNLTRDFISDFLRIISPHTIRPVSEHLLEPAEKEAIQKLVNVYLSYGLTFKEEKINLGHEEIEKNFVEELTEADDEHGNKAAVGSMMSTSTTPFLLTPPIDRIARFETHAIELDRSNNIQREIVAGQVLKHRMGNNTEKRQQNQAIKPVQHKVEAVVEKKPEVKLVDTQSAIATAAAPKVEAKKDRIKDFFTKAQSNSQGGKKGVSQASVKPTLPVTFKFQEGFTNAVRRSVYVKDFLN